MLLPLLGLRHGRKPCRWDRVANMKTLCMSHDTIEARKISQVRPRRQYERRSCLNHDTMRTTLEVDPPPYVEWIHRINEYIKWKVTKHPWYRWSRYLGPRFILIIVCPSLLTCRYYSTSSACAPNLLDWVVGASWRGATAWTVVPVVVASAWSVQVGRPASRAKSI